MAEEGGVGTTGVKSTITMLGIEGWVHREEVEADTKLDAFHKAYALAEQWGFQVMRSHTTTVGNAHFVTLYGTRRHLLNAH